MTELLSNDQMSMDRINPYTLTTTFGISYNGGYKGPAPQYPTIPEGPAEWDVEGEVPEYTDHMQPLYINRSGPMMVKTGSSHPATSFLFPARKYQFDDGSATFSREIVWKDGQNYISGLPTGWETSAGDSLTPIIVVFVLLLILIFVARKMKL
jgi:hypothetical protein